MLKILQAMLQHYVNHELPDVQAGFRKGRGTKDQIANICWIIKKAREFQKNIYLLVCEMSAIVQLFEYSLVLPFFGIGRETDLFQSCGHC